MAGFTDYREGSRRGWGTDGKDAALTFEQITVGAVLRIADAAEKMAKNYDDLIRSRNMFRQRAEGAERENEQLRRSAASLRGYIGRLKKARE